MNNIYFPGSLNEQMSKKKKYKRKCTDVSEETQALHEIAFEKTRARALHWVYHNRISSLADYEKNKNKLTYSMYAKTHRKNNKRSKETMMVAAAKWKARGWDEKYGSIDTPNLFKSK